MLPDSGMNSRIRETDGNRTGLRNEKECLQNNKN